MINRRGLFGIFGGVAATLPVVALANGDPGSSHIGPSDVTQIRARFRAEFKEALDRYEALDRPWVAQGTISLKERHDLMRRNARLDGAR